MTRTAADTPIMRIARHRTALRLARALVVALVGGLLLFPATCSHAAMPHSLFQDMRVEVIAQPGVDSHHAHHAHHAAAPRTRAETLAHTPAPGDSRVDRTEASDLPDTVSTALAASPVVALGNEFVISLPPAPRIAAEPEVARGPAPAPPDAPPPRRAA